MPAIGECLNRNKEINNTFRKDLVFETHKNAENSNTRYQENQS